jgi:hypothetical protein
VSVQLDDSMGLEVKSLPPLSPLPSPSAQPAAHAAVAPGRTQGREPVIDITTLNERKRALDALTAARTGCASRARTIPHFQPPVQPAPCPEPEILYETWGRAKSTDDNHYSDAPDSLNPVAEADLSVGGFRKPEDVTSCTLGGVRLAGLGPFEGVGPDLVDRRVATAC